MEKIRKLEASNKLLVPKKEDARIIYGRIPLQKNDRHINIGEFKQFFNKKELNQKFRLSPFTKIFEGENGEISLFHSYLCRKIYGGRKLKKFLIDIKKTGSGDIEILKELVENDFVIPDSFSENEFRDSFIKEFRDKIYNTTPDIRVMYLILTDRCNLKCKYCFIEEGALKGSPKYGDMSYETAKSGLDFFIDQIKTSGEKRIIFYGGEPVLNPDVMRKVTVYIRNLEKLKKFNGPVVIQLITNGTLVTPDIAKFLAEKKVKVGVSIDGPKEIHDQMRTCQNNSGSFDQAIRGYMMLKKVGVEAGISCTIGKHNVECLDKIVEYFVKDLKVRGIGFNMPNLIKGQESLAVPIETITENLIRTYTVCRKYGIAEDRLGERRVKTFVEERFWANDCAGCGNQIVVLPNGSVGPCHAFLGSAKYFDASVFKKEDLRTNPTWIEWRKRSPLFMEQCKECSAISICGGGCPYIANDDHGSIWELDNRMCVFCNRVLEWLIGELYKKLNSKRC